MARYALVCDGTVENVVLWDGKSDWTPPVGCDLIPLDEHPVSPGDTYDGKTFTATPVPPALVAVQVDPQAVSDALAAAQKATTVAALRSAVVALGQQLTNGD